MYTFLVRGSRNNTGSCQTIFSNVFVGGRRRQRATAIPGNNAYAFSSLLCIYYGKHASFWKLLVDPWWFMPFAIHIRRNFTMMSNKYFGKLIVMFLTQFSFNPFQLQWHHGRRERASAIVWWLLNTIPLATCTLCVCVSVVSASGEANLTLTQNNVSSYLCWLHLVSKATTTNAAMKSGKKKNKAFNHFAILIYILYVCCTYRNKGWR